MAVVLPESVALTVVTSLPEVTAVLLRRPLCEVIISGGAVQRSSGGYAGSPAFEQTKVVILDQGFIGGCAASLESGLTDFDYADYEFKKAVIGQCSEVIVGLTSDKIPVATHYVVTNSSQIDVLVIEGGVSKKYAEVLQEADLQIYEIQGKTVLPVHITPISDCLCQRHCRGRSANVRYPPTADLVALHQVP